MGNSLIFPKTYYVKYFKKSVENYILEITSFWKLHHIGIAFMINDEMTNLSDAVMLE